MIVFVELVLSTRSIDSTLPCKKREISFPLHLPIRIADDRRFVM